MALLIDQAVVSCLNKCHVQRFLVFLIVCCFEPGEVGWAGKNAGNTHPKKSFALLWGFWPAFLVPTDMVPNSKHLWPGAGRQRVYNSLIAAKHAFFDVTEHEPVYLHFSYANQMHVLNSRSNVRTGSPWALRKKLCWWRIFCLELSFHDSRTPLQVLV